MRYKVNKTNKKVTKDFKQEKIDFFEHDNNNKYF